MLTADRTVLVVVDVQGKLAQIMFNRENLFANIGKMIRGIRLLGIPIIWLEQNPRGLGPTAREIADLMPGIEPISKMTFSCCGNPEFMRRLESLGRGQVLLVGIETHVCIYQTAMDLVGMDYEVQVVADAVSSRTEENKTLALTKIRDLGAGLTTTETALFELLKVAKGPKFKEMLRIVK
jgi:nicotinamidase-related amidase